MNAWGGEGGMRAHLLKEFTNGCTSDLHETALYRARCKLTL